MEYTLQEFDNIATLGDLKEFLEFLKEFYYESPVIKIFDNTRSKIEDKPTGKKISLKILLEQVMNSKNKDDKEIRIAPNSDGVLVGFSIDQIKTVINNFLKNKLGNQWRDVEPPKPKRDEQGNDIVDAKNKGNIPNGPKIAIDTPTDSQEPKNIKASDLAANVRSTLDETNLNPKEETKKEKPQDKPNKEELITLLFNEVYKKKSPKASSEDLQKVFNKFLKSLSNEDKKYIKAYSKEPEDKEKRAEVKNIINSFLKIEEPVEGIIYEKANEGTKTIANTNEPQEEEQKKQSSKDKIKNYVNNHKQEFFDLITQIYEEFIERPNAVEEGYTIDEKDEEKDEEKKNEELITVISEGIKQKIEQDMYDAYDDSDNEWLESYIKEQITKKFLPVLLKSHNQFEGMLANLTDAMPKAVISLSESNKESLEKLIKEYKKKEEEILQLESATKTDNDFLRVYQKYISSDLRNYIKRLYGLAFTPNEQFDLNKVIKTIYNYMGRPANGLSDAQKIATKVYLDLVSFNSQMNTIINKPDQANIKPKLATIEKSDEFINYNPKLFNQLHRTQSSFNQMKSMKNYKPDYNNYSPYQNINQLRYTRVRDF